MSRQTTDQITGGSHVVLLARAENEAHRQTQCIDYGVDPSTGYTSRKATTVSVWANQLLERKPARLVTAAVANKMARIAWAMMAREEEYRAMPARA